MRKDEFDTNNKGEFKELAIYNCQANNLYASSYIAVMNNPLIIRPTIDSTAYLRYIMPI
jgi:hypothetical protein